MEFFSPNDLKISFELIDKSLNCSGVIENLLSSDLIFFDIIKCFSITAIFFAEAERDEYIVLV